MMIALLIAIVLASSVASAASAGGWHVQSSPNVAGKSNFLYGITRIPGTRIVWAVGTVRGGSSLTAKTLVLHSNGHGWHIVPSANVKSGDRLAAVAARTKSDVWSVGEYAPQGISHALAIHWNGSKWTSRSPAPNSDSTFFQGVVPLGAHNVWAVGEDMAGINPCGGPGGTQLLEHWNGTRWHRVAGPSVEGETSSSIGAVTRIPRTNHLVAIGSACIDEVQQPILLRYNGTSWNFGPAPLEGGFSSIAAVSGGDLLAVGFTAPLGSPGIHPAAAHWNGSAWSLKVFNLPAGADDGFLGSVCRVPHSHAYLVAGEIDTPNQERPFLAERDNGWHVQSAPTPDPLANLTNSITCGAGGSASTAGWRGASTAHTLILHRPA